MTKRISSRIARPIGIAIALICGGLVTATDAPRAQPSADPASQGLDGSQPPAIESTTPAAEAVGVSGRNPLIVQFNKHMAEASLNSRTLTLVGPAGAEPVHVVPLEQGRLVFVWPDKELLPASRYTLFVQGATDAAQRPLPLGAIGFDTAAKPAGSAAPAATAPGGGPDTAAPPAPDTAPAPVDLDAQLRRLGPAEQQAVVQANLGRDPEDWQPGPEHFHGRWRADRDASPLQALPPLRAAAGTTALSGQVLGMNGRAVPGVTLRIADREVRTDVTGRFLLQDVPAGFAKLEIDGETASRPDARYGYYAARVELKAQKTTVLPYVIWMPRLDPAGTVRIAAPTTAETVIRSPRIPGLELHIPAGTVIRDRQGRILTEVNVTAIPVDRPPFPVPDLGVPTYFTVQPGGAVLQSVSGKPGPGARLFYPNFNHEVPGARGTFWNYDPEDRGWFVYGLGTISHDATQAIPDDGVVIHELTGAMFNGGNTPGPDGPPPCDCGGSGGDPVSLVTGQFDHTERDMVVADVVPIAITRTYDSKDVNRRAFGIGMIDPYDIYFFSQNQYQEVDLILPNNTRVHYVRTSPGTGFADAVLESTAPGQWAHSVVSWNPTRPGWELRFRDGRKWFFAELSPIAEMSDANGNVTRILRQGGTSGPISQITSQNGRTVTFSYNPAGLVSAITDNLGRRVTYSYDGGGRLLEVVDPLGGRRDYTWDTTNNRITEIHDGNGNLVVRNEYGGDGRVFRQTLADGNTFRYVYVTTQGGVPTQTLVTDPRGTTRSVFFDAAGYVVQNVFPTDITDQQVTHYEYTPEHHVAAVTDPLDRRTEFQYDSLGNVTRITRLAGTANAASVSMTYDAARSLPLTVTDGNGNTTTMSYDAGGNLRSVTDPLGNVTSFEVDGEGRPTSSTDPLGRVTRRVYDGADLSSVTDPMGHLSSFLTDAAGRRIATVDPLGNRTLFERDDLGRLTRVIDAIGGITTFQYDPEGHLLTYTDANGHSAGYEYNSIGKVQSFWDARSKWETRQYEPGGKVSQFIDRKGQLRAITYDALGRVATVGYGATAAHPTAYQSLVENTWDAGNRLIQIVDKTCADPVGNPGCASVVSSSTITRSYDDLDRLISEITPQGEVDYTYDSGGRRSSMAIKNGPPGAQIVQPLVAYSYDAANRLVGIHQAAGAINGGAPQDIAVTYDAAGQRTQVAFPNGATATYAYDDASDLTSIVYRRADGSQIGDLHYSYDPGGQMVEASGSLARMTLPATDVTDASYDANDRLVAWSGKAYAYDDNGNLVDDGTNTYEWNERNRLTRISRGVDELARFQYDSVGRRTGKTIGSLTTGFVYDHKNVVQELRGVTSADAVTAHLLTAGTDELFLRIEDNDGANLRSVLSDGNHNTLMLLDAAQQVVVNYAYGPYGAVTADASTPNRQQFTGRDNDDPGVDQGLYYYRARYYMPGIARFISEDPIGWSSGQANNYAYVGGDPINFRDPLGHDAADNFENFSAGFGDAITFGLTRWIRKGLGIDGVATCSAWYTGGEVAGVVALTIATAGVASEAEAGADAAEALAEEEAEAEGAAADGAEQAPKAFERALKEAQRELKRNKDFRRWFHREFKPGELSSDGISHNLDLTEEQLVDAYQEWIELGRPTVK